MEEGINGSKRSAQPCLPNSAQNNEMQLLNDDRRDLARFSRSNGNGNQDYIEIRSCHVDGRLNWTMLEQGLFFLINSFD